MTLDQTKFAAIVADAKAKAAGSRRWIAAIEKAAAGVVSGWWVITELADCVAVTTETGKTYFANGVCQCEAFKNGQACKHRALYRLLAIYNEEGAACLAAPSPENAGALEKGNRQNRQKPSIVRSVESDRTGVRYAVTRVDNWVI